MEISYRISEKQYQRIRAVQNLSITRSATLKTILFWVFILVCLILLWSVVQHAAPVPPPTTHTQPVPHASHGNGGWTEAWPFFAAMLAVAVLSWKGGRASTRRLYQSDPMMQGEFSVNITPQSISMRNSAGATAQWSWNLFDHWSECGDLILLAQRSGTSLPVSMAGLQDLEKIELRAILGQVLAKR